MSMELDNVFTVPVPPETAWDVLLDVSRIAPCMPGAAVDEVNGDEVTGRIKVKVGPVSLTYKGTAKFIERDAEARKVTVEAAGRETRGAGTASATVQASLAPAEGGSTLVTMHTTMNVTGRPAQFGRGVMVEVGGKLVDQFAKNLAAQLTGDSAASTAADTKTAAHAEGAVSAAAGAEAAEGGATANGDVTEASEGAAGLGTASTAAVAPASEDSLNLVRLAGPAILKRVIPVAAVSAAIALLIRRVRRGLRRGAA